MTTEVASDIDTVTKVVIRPPNMYNVVLYNDDRTTVDFVIMILMQIFHKDFDTANKITLHIHNSGRGVAGTYTKEIAQQKRDDTTTISQSNGFQLKCEIEPVQ